MAVIEPSPLTFRLLYCTHTLVLLDSLCSFSWYHGKISREEAEAMLNNFREEGDFLIRDSVHFQGDYSLSIYFDGMVDHYRIIAKSNKLEVDGGDCLFDNLIQLVEVL